VEGVKIRVSALRLLNASCALGNTVIVVHSYLPSSPNPCITVKKDGKRVSKVPLELYQQGTLLSKSPFWNSITNDEGTICTPELPDGIYEIYAKSGRRNAELDIEVSKNDEVTGFEMALPLPDQLLAAAGSPIAAWVHEFRGVVEDATGAVIRR
jgi:hypothetical protein